MVGWKKLKTFLLKIKTLKTVSEFQIRTFYEWQTRVLIFFSVRLFSYIHCHNLEQNGDYHVYLYLANCSGAREAQICYLSQTEVKSLLQKCLTVNSQWKMRLLWKGVIVELFCQFHLTAAEGEEMEAAKWDEAVRKCEQDC